MTCTCVIGIGLDHSLVNITCPLHGLAANPQPDDVPVLIEGMHGTTMTLFFPRRYGLDDPILSIEVACDHGHMLGQLDFNTARAMRDRITRWLENNDRE